MLLRGFSPFSVAERELIAAYVSGLNACGYCHGVHTATAEAFGVPDGLLSDLLADVEIAAMDERIISAPTGPDPLWLGSARPAARC